MTVIGYIFLGESDTGIDGVKEQRSTLEQYAASLGLRLDRLCIDRGVSLKRPFGERPQGRGFLAEVEPGDIIVAAKAAWVLGSAREGLNLINRLREKNVSLYCVDLAENLSLPMARKLVVYEGGATLIRQLLMSIAECESSSHGDSIKAAKRQMKKEGKYLGGPVPFGWQVKAGFLVKDVEQQKIIRKIQKLRADRWSYRDIAGKLKDLFGVQLSHEGIRKILLYNEKTS
jgi:DNA invertase Pin-like site-specific DNA recombinase